VYQLADHLIIDELKSNSLKFIALNIVSYLEPAYFDRLASLPTYLIREIENFIKVQDPEKFGTFDMGMVERKESLDAPGLPYGDEFDLIIKEFDETVESGEGVKWISEKAMKFRSKLRKRLKQFRKWSSRSG